MKAPRFTVLEERGVEIVEQDFLPGPGHNLATAADLARDRVDALVGAANKWAAIGEIATPDQAAKAADFLDQIGAEAKVAEQARMAEKRPHMDAAKAVDAAWAPLLDKLGACKLLVTRLHSAWLRKEQERIALDRRQREAEAREAQRKAAEAASKPAETVDDVTRAHSAQRRADEATAALAAVPQRAQVRGNLSGRARSLRTTWHARVDDLVEALSHYIDRPELAELVERLANADARAGVRDPNLPGCHIYSTQE